MKEDAQESWCWASHSCARTRNEGDAQHQLEFSCVSAKFDPSEILGLIPNCEKFRDGLMAVILAVIGPTAPME